MTGSKLGLFYYACQLQRRFFLMATFNGSHGKGFILTLNNIKICQEPAWIFACSLNFLYLRGIL